MQGLATGLDYIHKMTTELVKTKPKSIVIEEECKRNDEKSSFIQSNWEAMF